MWSVVSACMQYGALLNPSEREISRQARPPVPSKSRGGEIIRVSTKNFLQQVLELTPRDETDNYLLQVGIVAT